MLRWHPDALPLSSDQAQDIAACWAARAPGVFNGRLLHVTHIQPNKDATHIDGHFADYQIYYAQKQLGADFGLRPLGVSGLLRCDGHLILAKRAPTVTAYPGMLECAPSGSLSGEYAREDGSLDYAGQLRAEFQEEIGLSPDHVTQITPLALVYDPADRVYDLICQMNVAGSLDDLMDSLQASAEYRQPRAVPQEGVGAWYRAHHTQLIPTSQAALSLWMRRT